MGFYLRIEKLPNNGGTFLDNSLENGADMINNNAGIKAGGNALPKNCLYFIYYNGIYEGRVIENLNNSQTLLQPSNEEVMLGDLNNHLNRTDIDQEQTLLDLNNKKSLEQQIEVSKADYARNIRTLRLWNGKMYDLDEFRRDEEIAVEDLEQMNEYDVQRQQ